MSQKNVFIARKIKLFLNFYVCEQPDMVTMPLFSPLCKGIFVAA